jgi:hypothetical protein
VIDAPALARQLSLLALSAWVVLVLLPMLLDLAASPFH